VTVDVMLLDPDEHSNLYLGDYVRDGALVCLPRPARRAFALHRDVLGAMGCRSDVRTATQRARVGRDLLLVQAWTVAHGFRHVFVCHADLVTDPRWFGDLTSAFAAAGAATHLVCDNTIPGKVLDWADEHGYPIVTRTPTLPPPSAIPPHWAEGAFSFPQMLPEADFYIWLARCRDLLSPTEHAAVHGLYVHVFNDWLAAPPETGSQARQRLVQLVQTHRTQGEVLTCVRAAQAACFRQGLLLRLKLVHLLVTVQDQEHRPLFPMEIRSLHAYREPWISTSIVLRDVGFETREICGLALADVAPSGHVPAKHLNDEALLYVRAQRALRELEGCHPNAPLVPRQQREVGEAIRWARTDLNLPGVTRAHQAKEADWVDRMKVTLHRLTDRTAV
jgi:hypothetical protein